MRTDGLPAANHGVGNRPWACGDRAGAAAYRRAVVLTDGDAERGFLERQLTALADDG